MDENCVNIILIILGSISAFGTAFLVWKACQKPKAKLSLNNNEESITLVPYFITTESTKYYKMPSDNARDFMRYEELFRELCKQLDKHNRFMLTFKISNTGAFQLENYRVEIDYNENSCRAYQIIEHIPRESLINFPTFDGVNFSKEKPTVILAPVGVNSYLNQNDYDEYSFQISPKVHVERIELDWRIIAKDFNDKGKFVINVQPKLLPITEINQVYKAEDIPVGAERIEDLKPVINQLEGVLKEFE